MKTKRQHLGDYSKANRDIELAEVAISILESVSGCQTICRALKRKQQLFLRRIDRAAEELGAPYPNKKGGES